MKTFAQFLAEKLYDAYDAPMGYTEVFIDPTWGELSLCNSLSDGVGAWVKSDHAYIWDRRKAQHSTIRNFLKISGVNMEEAWPFYFYPRPPQLIYYEIAYWTAEKTQAEATPDEMGRMFQTHPTLKIFKFVHR